MTDTMGTPARATGLFSQLSKLFRATPKQQRTDQENISAQAVDAEMAPPAAGSEPVTMAPTQPSKQLVVVELPKPNEVFKGRVIRNMSLAELQRSLDSMGLSSKGSKSDLIERLTLAITKLNEVQESLDESTTNGSEPMPSTLEEKRDALALAVKSKWPFGMPQQEFVNLATQLVEANVRGKPAPKPTQVEPDTPISTENQPINTVSDTTPVVQSKPTQSARKRSLPDFSTSNNSSFKRRSLGGGMLSRSVSKPRLSSNAEQLNFGLSKPTTLFSQSQTPGISDRLMGNRPRTSGTPRRHSLHSSLLLDGGVYQTPTASRTNGRSNGTASNRQDITKKILESIGKMGTPLDEVRSRRAPSWVTPRSKLSKVVTTGKQDMPPSSSLVMPPKVIQVKPSATPKPVPRAQTANQASTLNNSFSVASTKQQSPKLHGDEPRQSQKQIQSSSVGKSTQLESNTSSSMFKEPASNSVSFHKPERVVECSFGFSPPVGVDIDQVPIAKTITEKDMMKYTFTAPSEVRSRTLTNVAATRLPSSISAGSLATFKAKNSSETTSELQEPISLVSNNHASQQSKSLSRNEEKSRDVLLSRFDGESKAKTAEPIKPQVSETKTTPKVVGNTDWMAKFLPKEGEWKCNSCSVINPQSATACVSCEVAKEPASSSETAHSKPSAPAAVSVPVVDDWMKQYLPKEGQWKCEACSVLNEQSAMECVSCETPKQDNNTSKQSKEESSKQPTPTAPSSDFKFGAASTASATPSFAFGNSNDSATSASTKVPSFGTTQSNSTPAATKTPLFGNSAGDSKPSAPLFNGSSNESGTSTPLFGGSTSEPAKETPKPLFGVSSSDAANETPKPLFGNSTSEAAKETPKPLFGGSDAAKETPKPLFGGSSSDAANETPKPLFGGSTSDAAKETPKPLFGGSTSEATKETPKPLFGGSTSEATKETPKPLFGGSTSEAAKETPKPLFGGSTSEAAKETPKPLFGGSTSQPSSSAATPFVFGSTNASAPSSESTSTKRGRDDDEGTAKRSRPGSESSNPFLKTGGTSNSAGGSNFVFGKTNATPSDSNSGSGSGVFQFGATSSASNESTKSGGMEMSPFVGNKAAPAVTPSNPTNLFGAPKASEASAPTPFGGGNSAAATASTPSSNFAFGASSTPAPATTGSTFQFGASTSTTPAASGGLFGGTPQAPATNTMFGNSQPAPSTNMFGAASSTPAPVNNTSNMFGAKPSTPAFGAPAAATPGFGNNANNNGGMFGNNSTPAPASTAFGASGGMGGSSNSNMFGGSTMNQSGGFNSGAATSNMSSAGFGSNTNNQFGANMNSGFGNNPAPAFGSNQGFGANNAGGFNAGSFGNANVPDPGSQGGFSLGAAGQDTGGAKPRRKYRPRRRK